MSEASPRKRAAKKAADAPTKKASAKKPAAPKEARAGSAPPAARARPEPVHKENVVVPKDLYEAQKDALKAPFKEHGLKWQFLGEGKGRYHKEGVNVFVQFQDDGVHYALWGADQATVDAILATWRGILGTTGLAKAEAAGAEAVAAQEAKAESDALRLWRLQEPQRRPGEPDFFYKKRHAEWEAKRPA